MKKRLVTVKMNAWLTVFRQAKDGEVPDYGGNPDYDAEMSIYEQIGQDYWGESGIGAEEFKNQLDGLKGKKVLLRIHSPGGNVYDSMAMHNAIKEHGGVDTKVDGLAASAASDQARTSAAVLGSPLASSQAAISSLEAPLASNCLTASPVTPLKPKR